jgi:hypothetical protein
MTQPVATVPLALYDAVPVLLAGAGCFALARIVRDRAPAGHAAALTGAALVLAGGLAKVVWKVAVAAGWGDWQVLETGLFVLLAPGFALLAWSLLAVLGRSLPAWVPAVLVLVSEGGALALRSTGPLLAVTVLGATAVGVTGLLLARRTADGPAAWLFGVQLVLAFALVPLAAPPHTVGKQWAEELLNTVGQGAFALAAARLARRAAAPRRADDLVLTRSTA